MIDLNDMAWALLTIVLCGIYAFIKIRKAKKIKSISLHEKLMASTIKNPSDSPLYF
jgi:hypothetical protein